MFPDLQRACRGTFGHNKNTEEDYHIRNILIYLLLKLNRLSGVLSIRPLSTVSLKKQNWKLGRLYNS